MVQRWWSSASPFVEEAFAGENPWATASGWGSERDKPMVEMVGVVGEVHHYSLGRSYIPQVYVPFVQRPSRDANFVVKTSLPPTSLATGVRQAMEEVDPDQPLDGMQAAESLVSASISTPRFRTLLMSGFGLVALLLAVIGLYGVMAYSVSQRSKEIGVRMALGASRGSVLGLVFREGGPLVGVGLGLGLAGALALSRVLESMLFGVGVRDTAVFLAVPLVLAAVAAAALLVPARRATRVDPVRTLGGGVGDRGAPLPIFLPQPSAILDVETERLAPLDARGRRWPHRPVPLNEKPGGPRRHPGLRPAPMPSPIAGAGPRPPRCTGSSGNTWRRTSPWPMRPIPWATGYRITWKRSSGAT